MATSIRLAPETEQRLDYLASHTGRTKAFYLREIIEQMLASSGLLDFYATDKEGADRIENLQELVNAAEALLALTRLREQLSGS